MAREGCCGSGCQAGSDGGGSLNRREFLGGVAAGVAGAGLLSLAEASVASPTRRMTPEELVAWKKALFDSGEPIVYRSAKHPHAAVPMGGVGCGNVYVDSGGRLRDWLIFNNLEPVQVAV